MPTKKVRDRSRNDRLADAGIGARDEQTRDLDAIEHWIDVAQAPRPRRAPPRMGETPALRERHQLSK
jgi:hypothetical protein